MTDLEAIKARYPSVALAAPALIAEIESLRAERDRLREALGGSRTAIDRARLQFVFYYQQHAAKGTTDGALKAEVNEAFSFSMASALSQIDAALGEQP